MKMTPYYPSVVFQLREKFIDTEKGIVLPPDTILLIPAEEAGNEFFKAVDEMGRAFTMSARCGWRLQPIGILSS